ncbi:hypothetical protein [Bdellovibrio bacteriovorus]|uniref:hypothetical protein n=1 Tax=Bdellovibrio bacteriovorus TaxID=959 RepID=UPI001E3E283B|nr:hypothetical protein [Bdellovibrio bacteriovorus]
MPLFRPFLSFVLGLVTILSVAQAQARPQSALDVMTFEDEFTCNDKFPHHSFCEAVEFRPWSEAEKQIVGEYLANINDPRLGHLLEVIKSKGITKIHRVGYGATWYNNISKRRAEFVRSRDKALLWVNPVTNVIGFSDSFFTGTSFMDPHAKVDRKQINVFHELVHVFDVALGHISTSQEFYDSVGWHWDGKEHVIGGVDYHQSQLDFKNILALVGNKQSARAYAQDRELGIQYGFPTVYSMTNTHESFAEIISYYIFDPTAKDYLSPKIQAYVKSVLKED